jgi:hypothetical protein
MLAPWLPGLKARLSRVLLRGGRAGPTFNEAGGRGGRTNGAKRSILVDRIGLPIAVRVDSAKPHDVALRNVNPTTRSR